MDRLTEIRQRTEAATPGTWKAKETADYSEIYDNHSWGKGLSPVALVGSNTDDAAFIAHARDDMEYLLSEVDRLQAALSESQRRERAAVEDILDAALTPCTYCKGNSINGGTCDMRNDHHDMFACWQWRGPEAGKGDAPNE